MYRRLFWKYARMINSAHSGTIHGDCDDTMQYVNTVFHFMAENNYITYPIGIPHRSVFSESTK